MTECSCKTELLSSLNEKERESCVLYDCTLYIDGEVSESRVNFDMVVNVYSSLQKSEDSQTARDVPLKVWLYPLKNLDQSSAYVVKDISEGLLFKAEKVLDKLQSALCVSQQVISSYKSCDVITWFSALEEALIKFFSLLEWYHSEFRRKLASCIKSIREKGGEGEEKSLQDLLDSHDQSPFNSHYIDQWLRNKDAEERALNECRSANITIVKSSNDLQRIVKDSQADRVLCFTLTSLVAEDPYLSALRQHVTLVTGKITTEKQPSFTLADTSQIILSDLRTFLSRNEKEKNPQKIMFIAASIADPLVPGSCVRLYQSGSLVSCSVRLDVKPEPPEIIGVQHTNVTLKLQSSKNQKTEGYRVEYREANDGTPVDFKWKIPDTYHTEEICVISGLVPGTNYHVRYAVMDSKEMSDYSTITEVQTNPVPKPGLPTVINQDYTSIIIWEKLQTYDYNVICYKLDYMEAGLEGWQSIQTDGPECECTITVPYSTCYKARVSAVYADGKISSPSEEMKVPVRVWSIDLSRRKASIFLEVLKHQTGKTDVMLRDCTDDEREVRSFLQCLPYICLLIFDPPEYLTESHGEWSKRRRSFLQNLCLQAVIYEPKTFQETLNKCLTNFKTNQEESVFLLDLYSHLKDYEIRTGSSVLPALQPVTSVPAVWIINLSETKASLFLEVLKLQTKKKPVKVTGWTEQESEMRSFLQCLQYISRLRFNLPHNQRESPQELEMKVRTFLLGLCLQAALHQTDLIQTALEKCVLPHFKTDKDQSSFLLDLYLRVKNYEIQTDQSVLPALKHFYQFIPVTWFVRISKTECSLLLKVLKPQTVDEAAEWRWVTDDVYDVRNLLQCLPFISELRLCSDVVVRMAKASGFRAGLTFEELSVVCNIKCLNLTEYKMEAKPLKVLLNHQGPETIRFSEETLQDLAAVVYEAQEEEVTRCFLQKVGGDLMSCSLDWTMIHYFQKYHVVTVDFMKSSNSPENIRDPLPVLDRVQLRSCRKALLLQLLSVLDEGNEAENVGCAVALSKALGYKVNLSETQLNIENCRSLALFLDNCEGLSKLNLSHCHLNDQKLKLLLPHLHKTNFLDLTDNDITDISSSKIHDLVSKNSNIQIQISYRINRHQ